MVEQLLLKTWKFFQIHFYIIAIFLLNFVPITVYIIGDWLGTGIQFPWFTYIITYKGESFISAYTNLWYVAFGVLSLRTAISIILWEAGSILLAASTCLLLYEHVNASPCHKVPGTLTILAGVAMLASLVQQYGPLFHGPAGIAIPIGLPLVFVVGWWVYRYEEPVDAAPADEQAADGSEPAGERGQEQH